MHPKYSDIDYFNLRKDQKDFVQHMAFLDFIEEVELILESGESDEDIDILIEKQINWEISHYQYHEDFETCQLLKDVLDRFQKNN